MMALDPPWTLQRVITEGPAEPLFALGDYLAERLSLLIGHDGAQRASGADLAREILAWAKVEGK